MVSQATLATLLPVYGPWLVFAVVAIESAGIPLPGEMTLIAAALLANKTEELSITTVVIAAAVGAIVGDNFGYWAGRRFGRPLLQRYGRKVHLDRRVPVSTLRECNGVLRPLCRAAAGFSSSSGRG